MRPAPRGCLATPFASQSSIHYRQRQVAEQKARARQLNAPRVAKQPWVVRIGGVDYTPTDRRLDPYAGRGVHAGSEWFDGEFPHDR